MSASHNQGERGGRVGAIGASFATSAAIQAINVLTGVALARTLGPHGRGELVALILWPSILAAFGSLGLSEAVTYHCARARENAGVVTGTAIALGLAQSFVLGGIGTLVVSLLGHYRAGFAVHTAL